MLYGEHVTGSSGESTYFVLSEVMALSQTFRQTKKLGESRALFFARLRGCFDTTVSNNPEKVYFSQGLCFVRTSILGVAHPLSGSGRSFDFLVCQQLAHCH